MKRFSSFLLCVLIGFVSTGTQAQSAPAAIQPAAPDQESLHAQDFGAISFDELKVLAEGNNAAAQNALALRYSLGAGGADKDEQKAIEWFRTAAVNGSATAYFNLGAAFYNGDGVRLNEEESCKWFILAAEAGMKTASAAVDRAKKAMSVGHLNDCQLLVADAYFQGKEIKQDYPKAMYWYRKLADEKIGVASERIAVMYDRGWGVPQDHQQSVVWLRRASDEGSALARYELGRLSELGIIVPQDYQNAKKLYEEAANDLFTPAMVALSKLYREGRGVKTSAETAYMWAVLAANQKNPEGYKLASVLSKELAATQIQDAKKEAAAHLRGRLGLFVPKQ